MLFRSVSVNAPFDNLNDVPNLVDIESVNFEQYLDPVTKTQKIRALIKIRNSSKNPLGVEAVDARIFNPNSIVVPVSSLNVSQSLTTPTPSVPEVVFKRDGTTISWGWDNATGLGSYSSVEYEWIISTTSSPSATTLNSGTLPYNDSITYPIGSSSYAKQYMVSSKNGDTASTASPRWLRVRTKVVGKDNLTYYSNYSMPI